MDANRDLGLDVSMCEEQLNPSTRSDKYRIALTDAPLNDLLAAVAWAMKIGRLDELESMPERSGPRLLEDITSDHRKFHGQFLRRCYMAARLQERSR